MSENTGKVMWYNSQKGFGLIKVDGSEEEAFIHHSNIQSNKRVYLEENEEVKFNLRNEKGKLCAINLLPINGDFKISEPSFKKGKKKRRKKNTETFDPSHKPADMRVISYNASKKSKYTRTFHNNEVVIVNGLFCDEDDSNIYDKLLDEIKESGIHPDDLWKLWHGDTHLIVDDKKDWKKHCPTFKLVIDTIKNFFDMDVQATRFNLYKDSSQWKPYHHDAAAIKPHIAKIQNTTIGVSFGAEREASFEHAKTRTVVSFPLPNGSIYIFNKDTNIEWRHGIPQLPPERQHDKGRISIIAWGKVNMEGKI